jgi:N-succinyl-L-ornithine transcarbamylase
MKNFISPHSLTDINSIVKEAIVLKNSTAEHGQVGKGKTMILLFFNSSLRTRISTQIAAEQLGMNVLSMDMSASWNLEFEDGAIMRFDRAEHIKDAAAVFSRYADIIGVRAFAKLENKEADYSEQLINALGKYSSIPVVNLESSIRHPLQSLADMMTIEEAAKGLKPKIVLSWAPHPKALPHAVANSFLEWAQLCDHQVTVTHPVGYELFPEFMKGHQLEYDQNKALKDADFIYVKNWSATSKYGQVLNQDPNWILDEKKMNNTNEGHFMHCMPIRRNVIATDGVIDSPHSLMYEQAHNRLHSAKYVIKSLLENA